MFREMETHLGQQLCFSAVAALGIGAMHFAREWQPQHFYTIMAAPTVKRGYPPGLGLLRSLQWQWSTCIVANGLLAHSATVSRDKLAEVF